MYGSVAQSDSKKSPAESLLKNSFPKVARSSWGKNPSHLYVVAQSDLVELEKRAL